MLRLTKHFANLTFTRQLTAHEILSIKTVRRPVRKPRHLPMAKSKMFKIPPRPQIPREEVEELKRLHNNYRTQMKSLTNYFAQKYSIQFTASADTEQQKKAFEEDFLRCNELNEKWNAEIKVEREKRLAQELEESIEKAKDVIIRRQEKETMKQDLIEEIVRNEKEASKTFITPENLDTAIEHALTNQVDYNFAIDLNGNKIAGRETIPEEIETKINVKQ